MIKLTNPKDYSKYLISQMISFIPESENVRSSALISAKYCAIQSVKENIYLLNFINQTVKTPLTQYYEDVLQELILICNEKT